MYTENVARCRRVFCELEVFLLENVKADVSVKQKLLNIQIGSAQLSAVSARDEHYRLGHASSEL